MSQFQWHHFVTILSGISILSQFCHNFVLIYDETTETIQQRQAQSSDWGILQWDQKCHCCHWIDECLLEQCGSVIFKWELMHVILLFPQSTNRLKTSFVWVENRVFCIFVSTDWFKSRFFKPKQGDLYWAIKWWLEKKRQFFLVKCSLKKNNLSYVNKKSKFSVYFLANTLICISVRLSANDSH